MSDEIPNLTHEHLRHLRRKADISEMEMADMKTRMSAQEEISGQILILLGTIAKKFDRFDERLARIERRLDIVEA